MRPDKLGNKGATKPSLQPIKAYTYNKLSLENYDSRSEKTRFAN